MIVLAHIFGIPVEECLMPVATGVGSAMLFGFTWVLSLRHQRSRRPR
jgi:hypothetical protein